MSLLPRILAVGAAAIALLASAPELRAQNQGVAFPAGNSAWISAPAGADVAPVTGMTVEAWVRVSTTTAPTRGVIYVPSTGTNFSYQLGVTADLQGNIMSFQGDTSAIPYGGWHIDGGPFSSNVWHHFAGTYDGTTARLFIDGAQYAIGNTSGTIKPPANQLRIGSIQTSFFFHHGSIDGIRIWSYALSQAEIAAYRYFEIPGLPGLVASWYFNGNLSDSSGSHDGTAVGTISFGAGAPITPMLSAPPSLHVGNALALTIASPFPGTPYIADVSLTGAAPGVLLMPEGILIPLNHPWLNYDSGGLLSSYFTNFLGVTNAIGGAQAFVAVPPYGALAGSIISATYVMLAPGVPYSIGYVAPPSQTLLIP